MPRCPERQPKRASVGGSCATSSRWIATFWFWTSAPAQRPAPSSSPSWPVGDRCHHARPDGHPQRVPLSEERRLPPHVRRGGPRLARLPDPRASHGKAALCRGPTFPDPRPYRGGGPRERPDDRRAPREVQAASRSQHAGAARRRGQGGQAATLHSRVPRRGSRPPRGDVPRRAAEPGPQLEAAACPLQASLGALPGRSQDSGETPRGEHRGRGRSFHIAEEEAESDFRLARRLEERGP